MRRGGAHAREAEDACELVDVSYEPLPAVTDPETALDPATPVIHASLGDNLCFERKLDAGGPDKAFAEADAVVETTFVFGRHTGVTTEPRAVVADWNPGDARLTVYHGTQAPHMMQDMFAKHLALGEAQVRVSPRTSAARSASRCTFMPTRWRRWRCRNCSSAR